VTRWTTTAPTAPGWYWWRDVNGITRACKVTLEHGKLVSRVSDCPSWPAYDFDTVQGEWCLERLPGPPRDAGEQLELGEAQHGDAMAALRVGL